MRAYLLTDEAARHCRGSRADVARQSAHGAVVELRRDITGDDQITYRKRVVEQDSDQIAESDGGNDVEYLRKSARNEPERLRKTAVYSHSFGISDKAACPVLDVAHFDRSLYAAVLNDRVAGNSAGKSAR